MPYRVGIYRCHVDVRVLIHDERSVKKNKMDPAISGPEATSFLLAGQLQICITALKSNQPDLVIGEHSCLTLLRNI